MAEEGADFAAHGSGAAVSPRSDDDADRSPTWRELRDEGARTPAVLKPGRKSPTRARRRRGRGARSSHSKMPAPGHVVGRDPP
eukprot:15468602-Alexandrium_andersonii.AAC.1